MYSEYMLKSCNGNKETPKILQLKHDDSYISKPFYAPKNMEPFYRGNYLHNSNHVIQMVKIDVSPDAKKSFIDERYKGDDEMADANTITQNINVAIGLAIQNLNKAAGCVGYLLLNRKLKKENASVILGAINTELGIFQHQLRDENTNQLYAELEIIEYDGDYKGETELNSVERPVVYINYGKHNNLTDIAKTLIHEVFHVQGGSARVDTVVNNIPWTSALQKISSCKQIKNMSADYFAHFVIHCSDSPWDNYTP